MRDDGLHLPGEVIEVERAIGLCSIGGGGGQSKGSSDSQPWLVQQPYLDKLYQRANDLYNKARSFFPDKTYVGFSPESERALQRTSARAEGGSPVVSAAQRYTADVLDRKYLDPESNPYLRSNYDAAARASTQNFKQSVIPGTSLARYGRGGSGAEANRLGTAYDIHSRNLNELASRFYGDRYDREREIMEGAASRAPGLADYDYRDISQLAQVGAAREALSARELDDAMQRYYFREDEPRERLTEYANWIGQPVQTSRSRQSAWNVNGSIAWG